jgi:peptidoglycan/xylan/chitin deacetylase (PgdA/CDA1 family)
VLKQAAEFLLARGGMATLAARRRRGSALILAYHNIVPDDAPPIGDRSLHLSMNRFRSQLDRLEETHDVVELTAVRAPSDSSNRPRAAITFDDAYRGALTLALPELARRGLPATVFVAPGLLGSSGCWWDLLAASDGSGLLPSVRSHVLEVLRGDGVAAVSWARSNALPLAALSADAGIATEEELRAAAAFPGVRLGSHTWSHRNLACLNDAELDSELVRPIEWLRQRFSGVVPWLAYPYGLFAPTTAHAAQRAGYDGALRIEGGWVAADAVPAFVLPRLNVPAGLSPNGFILRACGLMRS